MEGWKIKCLDFTFTGCFEGYKNNNVEILLKAISKWLPLKQSLMTIVFTSWGIGMGYIGNEMKKELNKIEFVF